MKRAAILSIAAFYLLLTTGMFVCMVHCTGQSLFHPKTAMQAMNHDEHQGNQHKHNAKDKDCDCCKKHGNYVIKENIKPGTVALQSPQMAVVLREFNYIPLPDQSPALNTFTIRHGKAPPGLSGKAISIQLRSLQI
jgi:hypothetical protein